MRCAAMARLCSLCHLVLLLAASALACSLAIAATPRLNQARAWDKADINADGVLSRAEARQVPRLARHFNAIDLDGDGTITGGEVRAWRDTQRSGGRAKPAKGVDEIIRLADKNADDVLDRMEFSQGLPRFARLFERIDINRDERLTRGELSDWLSARRGARRSDPARQQRQRQ